MRTLAQLSRAFATGAVTARSLLEEMLERVADPNGEGTRVFIRVAPESARAQADAIDRERAVGRTPGAFAGIPLAIKDLFDVAGEVTAAGSRVLADSAPAVEDAPAIARLRAAGFTFIGRANMTEFAYSGLGLNPHHGTPRNPFDRATGRLPGGSSSGSAVAVTDGMAAAGIGTDTGGSCRIPAAFTGIVGFKPTANRVPLEGVVPLSPTLDSVGSLGHSVHCCATLDAFMRSAGPHTMPHMPLDGLRLLLPTTMVLDGMDDVVARVFERSVDQLARLGVSIVRQPLHELEQVREANSKGGIAAAEAYAWHRRMLEREAERYDPRVAVRIIKGSEQSVEDVRFLMRARRQLTDAIAGRTRGFDALVLPTVPIIAPALSACALDADYFRLNALALRNPSLANFLDGCSISLPIHDPQEPPVALMLIGRHGGDERLLAIANAIEGTLGRHT